MLREELLNALGLDEEELLTCSLSMDRDTYVLELAYRIPRQEAECMHFVDDCS